MSAKRRGRVLHCKGGPGEAQEAGERSKEVGDMWKEAGDRWKEAGDRWK